jgi:glycosyltransferase involved in cell wall biosynthesis
MLSELPKVSIVLPAYNVENTVGKCLASLLNQSYPNKEIIVVDDGSVDKTTEEVSKFPVKLIKIPHGGEGKARNEGMKFATGEVIFQGEADGFYAPNYVELCAKHLILNPKIGTVLGKGYPWPHNSLIWKWWNQLYKLRQVNYVPIGGWFFRKEDILEVGFYDEALERGTDVDLCIRLRKRGYSFSWEPSAVWWHKEAYSFFKLIKKQFSVGRGIIDFYQKQGRMQKALGRSIFILSSTLIILLCVILLLPPFYLCYAVFGGFMASYIIPIIKVKQKRQKLSEYTIYILLTPLISVPGLISNSLGVLIGYVEHFLKDAEKTEKAIARLESANHIGI